MKKELEQALEALDAMMQEFRSYDLPYGSAAYAKAKDARLNVIAALNKADDWIVNTGVEPTDGDAKVEVMFVYGDFGVDYVSGFDWSLSDESWCIVQYRYI